MLDKPSMTLRTIALILVLFGGIGNIGVAVWYIWKEKKIKRGFLHLAISGITLLGLIVILF